MGFSVTAASVIFFAAFLTAGSVALNAYWKTQAEMLDARRTEAQHAADVAHTSIAITNVTCAPTDCAAITSITLHVHNGGATGLNTTAWTYLLDGMVASNVTSIAITDPAVAIQGATELLLPGEDAAVTLPVAGSPHSLNVQVVTENGVSASAKVT